MEVNEKNESEELTDIEIAELANKELRKREDEILKLKKELAQVKLYSTSEEEERNPLTKDECIKIIGDIKTCNYDYAQAVIDLVDYEIYEGRDNPLGKHGNEVYDFFKNIIEECNGDKNRFTSIYQSKIGNDEIIPMKRK